MSILKEQVKRSKELMGIITESPEVIYEGMDATNIDLEQALDTEQEDWMGGDWDELDDNIQETFRQHEEFSGLDEAQIREKFNAMPLEGLCKISRFLFGWIVKLFRAPASAFTKSLRKNSSMVNRNYGRGPAWKC